MKSSDDAPAKKRQATFNLPSDLIEEMRAAAFHLSGPPHSLTLAKIAEDGIRRELARLQRKENDGQPFEPSEGRVLRRGRPLRRVD